MAVFDEKNHMCTNKKNLVLDGDCDQKDYLWDFSFPDVKMNYIIQKDKSKVELAQYLYGCAFSPSVSTFQTAIHRGNFITWPGIDEEDSKVF